MQWVFGIFLELIQYDSSCCPCTDLYSHQNKKQKRVGKQVKKKSNSCVDACISITLANPRETSSQRHTQPCIYNQHAKEQHFGKDFKAAFRIVTN